MNLTGELTRFAKYVGVGVLLGLYLTTDEIRNHRPVYHRVGSAYFLYLNDDGFWTISDDNSTSTFGLLFSFNGRRMPHYIYQQWVYIGNDNIFQTEHDIHFVCEPTPATGKLEYSASINAQRHRITNVH